MPSGQDASAGGQSGEDQVLSEAMDVFNQSKRSQGQDNQGIPGDDNYGDSGILDQTAGNNPPGASSGDATGTAGAPGAAGMDATQQQACADDSGQESTACIDAATAGGDGGAQQDGTTGMGGTGSNAGAGTDGSAAGVMGQADAGSGGVPGQQQNAGSGAGAQGNGGMDRTGTYGSGGYPTTAGSASGQPGSGGYGDGGNDENGTGGGAMTSAERVRVLDGQLNGQLAVFDGMILNKQQTVISEREENARTSGNYGTGGEGAGQGSAASGETAPLLTAMARGSSNSNAGGGMMPNQPGDNRQGDFGADPGQKVNIPADIPDGSDDDVVARQLREAAMKEKDPVLRDKLWDEYRKYKKGVALVK